MLYSVFLYRIGSGPSLRANITQGQIKRLQKDSSIEHEFSIFLVPRRTLVCNKILEDAGVLGDVSVEEFPLFFVPLEKNVLSLELEDNFGDLYLVCSTYPLDNQYLLICTEKRSNMHIPRSPSPHALAAKAWPLSAYPG